MNAEKFTYRLTRRQQEITSEVICAAHYAEESKDGRSMAPLSERERKIAGYEQKVTPYSGDRECALCLEERGQRGAA